MGGILTGNKLELGRIFSLAENPRLSRVLQYLRLKLQYSNGWGQTNTKYISMNGDRLTQNKILSIAEIPKLEPSRHLQDSFQTTSRHLPDTFQILSRHHPDTFKQLPYP